MPFSISELAPQGAAAQIDAAIQTSQLGAGAPLIATTADTDVSDLFLASAANTPILLDVSTHGPNTRLLRIAEGADTPAAAAALQRALGLTTVGRSTLLKIRLAVGPMNAGGLLRFGTGAGTHTNIDIKSAGAGDSDVQTIIPNSGTAQNGEIVIRASSTNVTPGAEVIDFDVMQTATA